jgi:hypothetical protein
MGMFFFFCFFVLYKIHSISSRAKLFFLPKMILRCCKLDFFKTKICEFDVHLTKSNKLVLFYLDEKKTTIDEFNLKRKVIRITWRKYI